MDLYRDRNNILQALHLPRPNADHSLEQDGHWVLVAIPWRALKEKIGPLEMVPVYGDKEQLEGRLMAR